MDAITGQGTAGRVPRQGAEAAVPGQGAVDRTSGSRAEQPQPSYIPLSHSALVGNTGCELGAAYLTRHAKGYQQPRVTARKVNACMTAGHSEGKSEVNPWCVLCKRCCKRSLERGLRDSGALRFRGLVLRGQGTERRSRGVSSLCSALRDVCMRCESLGPSALP